MKMQEQMLEMKMQKMLLEMKMQKMMLMMMTVVNVDVVVVAVVETMWKLKLTSWLIWSKKRHQ